MFKIEKRKLYIKKWISIFLSFIVLAKEHKNLKRSIENVDTSNRKVKHSTIFFVAWHMLEKSGRKFVLCKYTWSFSVNIYTQSLVADFSLNWPKEKHAWTLTHPFFQKEKLCSFITH